MSVVWNYFQVSPTNNESAVWECWLCEEETRRLPLIRHNLITDLEKNQLHVTFVQTTPEQKHTAVA